jgi:hypothetical protein
VTPEQIAEEREAWYGERERKDAEREAVRQRRKEQSVFASLIASGGATLTADPRLGTVAAIGKGIEAGLPVATAGLEDYAEAEERAFERGEEREAEQRTEKIKARSIELDRELQKLQLARASTTDVKDIITLDAQIEANKLDQERLWFAHSPGQRGAADRTPLENLAGRLLYKNQIWEGDINRESAIGSVVDAAIKRYNEEVKDDPVALGGAEEEERLSNIIRDIIGAGGTEESIRVGQRTEQDAVNAQDAMNTWVGPGG